MRKGIACLLPVLIGILLMGAVSPKAPVVVTNGFYVNDYANLLAEPHRDSVLALSRDLYDKTGVQLVVLTVESLMDLEMDTFVSDTVRGWDIGGSEGKDGVLIFVCTGERAATVYVGENMPYLNHYRNAEIEVGSNNVSKAVMNVYRPMAEEIYRNNGIEPSETARELLDNPQVETSPFSTGTVIFFAVMVLVVARSWRTGRKYRKKYLKGNVRKVRTYRRDYNEEKEYENEKIYRIDYDDKD